MNRLFFSALKSGLVLSFLITCSSSAQMRTQIHVGLNQTTFTGDSSSDFSSATRFSGGVGLGFPIGGSIYIQPELVYAVKGASAEALIEFPDVEGPVGVRARFSVTYFEMPLLLGYQLGGDSIRPRFYAGPYVAYKLKSSITFEAQQGGPAFTETDESVKDWDYGVVLGGALHFFLADEEFAVGARVSVGLAEITQATEGEDFDQSISNRFVGLYAAILF